MRGAKFRGPAPKDPKLTELTQLRSARTRAYTAVDHARRWMLTSHAEHVDPNGLPSWWPFWSDTLKRRTRELVRAGRVLAAAEGKDL